MLITPFPTKEVPMQPRNEDRQERTHPVEAKQKRFKVVRLEERVAPSTLSNITKQPEHTQDVVCNLK